MYGEGEAATRLGNDWAGGAEGRRACSCQQEHVMAASDDDQQPPQETQGISWLQQLMVWWRLHSKSLAAWLPVPEVAATQADFAVGDEAQHNSGDAATATTSVSDAQPSWDSVAATSMYRKLLSWKTFGGGSTDAAPPVIKSPPLSHPSAGCKCGSSAFAELQYNVYSLQDYDPVWEHYAYIYPVWVGDFGKNNMSASINMSAVVKVGGCWCGRQRKHIQQ